MNQVATISPRLPMPAGVGVNADGWRVLTEAIFPAAKSSESIALALAYCRQRGLDPFRRPVHIVPMWNSTLRREVETVWPGINELQVTAARTGAWAGMDAPEWGPEVTRTFRGAGRDGPIEATVTFPEWCSVRVWRLVGGQRVPFVEEVYWLETYARRGRTEVPNETWTKRVRGQLHKCAKAAALRAAFPEVADYTAEEMEGRETAAGGVVIEGAAEPHDAAAEMHAEMLRNSPPRRPRARDPEPEPEDMGEVVGDEIPVRTMDAPPKPKSTPAEFVAATVAEIAALPSPDAVQDWIGGERRRALMARLNELGEAGLINEVRRAETAALVREEGDV